MICNDLHGPKSTANKINIRKKEIILSLNLSKTRTLHHNLIITILYPFLNQSYNALNFFLILLHIYYTLCEIYDTLHIMYCKQLVLLNIFVIWMNDIFTKRMSYSIIVIIREQLYMSSTHLNNWQHITSSYNDIATKSGVMCVPLLSLHTWNILIRCNI